MGETATDNPEGPKVARWLGDKWGPGQQMGYAPGRDIEMYPGRHWVVYHTTESTSIAIAHGRGRLRLLLWFLRHPKAGKK